MGSGVFRSPGAGGAWSAGSLLPISAHPPHPPILVIFSNTHFHLVIHAGSNSLAV